MDLAQFEKTVRDYCRQNDLISPGDKVLIALSGGADSVCLFLCLKQLAQELQAELAATHIHHGIRGESADADAEFCRLLCEKEQVPFRLFYENVPLYAKEKGLTVEEAGRILRMKDLEQAAEEMGCNKTALAHHRDDQAETVLFHLLRGSGLSGAKGMQPKNGSRIRPLLCVGRTDIEAYLLEAQRSWQNDETNDSAEYTRNKIRLQLLPFAEKEISAGAGRHLAEFAEVAREAEAYIRRQAETLLEDIEVLDDTGKTVGIYVDKWLKSDPFLGKQALLVLTEKTIPGRKDLGHPHLDAMVRILQNPDNGMVSLPGGYRAEKSFNTFRIYTEGNPTLEGAFLMGENPPEMQMEVLDYTPSMADRIPRDRYTKWFDYDTIIGMPTIRHKQVGDALKMGPEEGSKSLKKYFTEVQIPASCRDRIWIVADEKGVLWVPGGRIGGDRKINDTTKRVLQITIVK